MDFDAIDTMRWDLFQIPASLGNQKKMPKQNFERENLTWGRISCGIACPKNQFFLK